MIITQFSVLNKRNIKNASCENLPRVMIVTGPNGCGKSTLLQELRSKSSGRRPMYVGPHRSSRRQAVRFRFLGPEINMRAVLEGNELPGYEGIRQVQSARSAWDHDDAPSFLKYSLCQIELDRRERQMCSDEIMKKLQAEAETAVGKIKQENKRREFFHGKLVLAEFYKRHMHATGMSKEIFLYECARKASERKSVRKFVSDFLTSLGLQELYPGQRSRPDTAEEAQKQSAAPSNASAAD